MLTFEIYKDKAGEWRWRLLAGNNKIIADSSEGYSREDDCSTMIDKIKAEASGAVVLHP